MAVTFENIVMDLDKINNKGQARLFKNRYLEMMTKTHPVVIYCMYFPVIFFMLYYGSAYKGVPKLTEVVLFVAGIFFWSFFEYLMHRYVFHLVLESKAGKRFVYTMHGVHHEFPRDKERLFMPPVPSIFVSGAILLLMYAAMGWYAMSFFPGFLLGYIIYGSMHYAIHAFAPPSWLKALWRNHHLHHYKSPDKGFGVSSVLWDVVFGTVPSKQKA